MSPSPTDQMEVHHMPNGYVSNQGPRIHPGETTRISNNGNLVVEHNRSGTEDVYKNGQHVAHEPLSRGDSYSHSSNRSYYPPSRPSHYNDNSGSGVAAAVVG